MVPREVGEAWLKHYRQELPAVAFKASTQQQADGLNTRRSSSRNKGGAAAQQQSFAAAAGSGCLGGDTLLQLLKNYARNTAGGKGSITVGVVGLPNVGKSSVINSLKRARVAQVGSTPGVTKGLQEIHLDKHIRLLDSPGIVFASGEGAAAAALRNAIKVGVERRVLQLLECVAARERGCLVSSQGCWLAVCAAETGQLALVIPCHIQLNLLLPC